MKSEPRPEGDAVPTALTAWRRKAADTVLAVIVAANLSVLVPGISGHSRPMGPLLNVMGIARCLVLAAAVLFRRIEYRTRLFVSFFALYAALAPMLESRWSRP